MDIPVQGLLGHNIHLTTQQILQIYDETGRKPW
jgi:hypothetical protein